MTLPEILALVEQYRGWLGMALIAGWVLYHRGWLFEQADRLKGMLPKWPVGSPAVVPAVVPDDPDYLDLQAAKRLKARYVRLGCKEGQAAMQVCMTHFFTEHGGA
jgi:hypothetical protein